MYRINYFEVNLYSFIKASILYPQNKTGSYDISNLTKTQIE